MKFIISAFTHKGTVRDSNQDCILVNGQLLNVGQVHLTEQVDCFCFVADGVGGNKGSDFASHFVLDRIKVEQNNLLMDAEQLLKKINHKLIEDTNNDIKLKGCCTTLTGLLVLNGFFKIIHAGDSEMWLLRNDMFFKITNDHVLNESEKNSSITSYFGGHEHYLKLDKDIKTKAQKRLENCLQAGAEDNISVILIHQSN